MILARGCRTAFAETVTRLVPARDAVSAMIQVGDNEDGGLGTVKAGRRLVVDIIYSGPVI